jgi:hypothetical protein
LRGFHGNPFDPKQVVSLEELFMSELVCHKAFTGLFVEKEIFGSEGVLEIVNPVRNSSGALNPGGIVLKCNPAAKQGGIISNGVKVMVKEMRGERSD